MFIPKLKSKAIKNFSWMFFGYTIQLGSQAIFFIILAKTLGAAQFGIFSSILALSVICSPLANFGFSSLIVKYGSRNRRDIIDLVLIGGIITVIFGLTMTIILIVIKSFLLSSSVSNLIYICIFISNVILSNFILLISSAFQAIELMKITSYINIATSFSRLLFLLYFVFLGKQNLITWSLFYFIATLLVTIICFQFFRSHFKEYEIKRLNINGKMLEGLFFSLSQLSRNIYTELDKILLARYESYENTGIYSVAYRFLSYSYLPISAVLASSSPGFFKSGEKGIKYCFFSMNKVVIVVCLYGMFASGMLYSIAPFVLMILGEEYIGSISVLKMLSIVIFIQSIHYVIGDILTASGYHHLRTIVQICVVIMSIFLNFYLISIYGIYGAVYSAIISNILLTLALFFVFIFYWNYEEKRIKQREL